MTEQCQDNSNNSKQAEKTGEDLTGRDRLVSNVIFNWIGHFVFIIAGFVLPRMIDRRLGQELLGVWDFAWSLVSYFGLVGAGIASSVNRYVARYRITGDISALNRIVSSVFFIMTIFGMLALGLTIAVSLLLPHLFGTKLGENVHEAQWVVLFLGAGIVIEIAFGAYNGVLTGCHRWGLRNIIQSGWHAAVITGMITALLMGKGLRTLSLIYLMGIVLAYVTRMLFAYRVCEGLRIHPSLVGWVTIRKVFAFGVKTLIPSVSQLLLNQTASILIVVYLGPAALALYARPQSLMRHIRTLVKKMATILTPTTSSIESSGNLSEIRELVIVSARYSLYLTLPIVLVLVVFGDSIIQLWMGARYANYLVTAILSIGYLPVLVQMPAFNILAGLNAHGRAGIAQLAASTCSVGLTVFVLAYLKWGIAGVALAVTLPLMIVNVTYLPFLICRMVNLNMRHYSRQVVSDPAIHIFPFAICLVVARIIFHTSPLNGLVLGVTVGGAILAVLYWRYVLPKSICVRVKEGISYLARQVST